MYVLYVHTCLPKEARQGHWISWSWNGRVVSHPVWVWGLNSGPLQEQYVIVTTGPALQPVITYSNF